MSPEAVTAIISATITLVTALGVFMARSKISEVLRSGTAREETAVQQMAGLLEILAKAQIDREIHLLNIQGRALDVVAEVSRGLTRVATNLDAHDRGVAKLTGILKENQKQIQVTVDDTQGDIKVLSQMVTDLGLEVIRAARFVRENGQAAGGGAKNDAAPFD